MIVALLFAGNVSAQSRVMNLGARAAGMGGAFTGVADDNSAFYWNPAGIAFGTFLSGGVYHGQDEADRDGRMFVDRASGLSLRYTFMGAAFTQFRQNVDGNGLDTFDLAVSVLQSLPVDNLVVAGNVHYLSGTTIFDGTEADSSSWDVDLGVMYEPNLNVRVGVMLSHLREARFVVPETDERLQLERHARAGVSFRLPQSFLIAFDADLSKQGTPDDEWREIALGVEKVFLENRAYARAGLSAQTSSDLGARPAFSIGAGVKVWVLELEAAYKSSSENRDEGYWFGISLAR